MSARHRAARQRRTFIARVARTMHREHGQVSPSDITHVAIRAGWKTNNHEVRHVLTRLNLHR
ncbi:hypothetical protein GTY83_19060 [Streptomyces sp. SID4928]|uniref:hypothetical protein n=1 Tax=unclassified Streptomyces TaxID=2593676 RepID=UPI0001C1A585|nr:hypothetical protein [Streptomyces sp. ACT-1]EGE43173.1 hypothetical protein SACT1_3841 [Streptomyces sp. ACT-1]MYR51210.1 hypothetical protein [Streptomyces sp. SID4928]